MPEITSCRSLATSSLLRNCSRKIRETVFRNAMVRNTAAGTNAKVINASLAFNISIKITSQIKMNNTANRLQKTSSINPRINVVSPVIRFNNSPGLRSLMKLMGSSWYFLNSWLRRSAAILAPSFADALLFRIFTITMPTLKENINPRNTSAFRIPPFSFSTSLIRRFWISGFKSVVTAARIIRIKIPKNSFLYGAAIRRKAFRKPPCPEHFGQVLVPGIARPQMGQVFSYSLLSASSKRPDTRMFMPLAIYA